jgi:hypothetical protein
LPVFVALLFLQSKRRAKAPSGKAYLFFEKLKICQLFIKLQLNKSALTNEKNTSAFHHYFLCEGSIISAAPGAGPGRFFASAIA